MTKREGWGIFILIILAIAVFFAHGQDVEYRVTQIEYEVGAIKDGADVLEVSPHGYVRFRDWETIEEE